ncbi:hypothetical protein M569_16097, partial [Genlisea aurea]
PVLAAVLIYRIDELHPVSYPEHELIRYDEPLFIPKHNSRMLRGAEKIGYGQLPAPEDIALDPQTGVIYTGCEDGWINRVTLKQNDSAAGAVVEKWINTGGRPLGIAHGLNGEVLVCDAIKGLLNISKDGVIDLLTDEAEGIKFKLTNAVDVAPDGTVYFTDASHSHSLQNHILDLLEGKPNGRFLSYNPSTKQTKVLVKDLFFANGVAVSPDHTFVIFCETVMRRCKRYYIDGPRKGSTDTFVENLPGLPDNVRYDGEGRYWIALGTEAGPWVVMQRYPALRKVAGIARKYAKWIKVERNGGAVAHLYCGCVHLPYIVRLNLTAYPAT